jgi:hypothetical protein
MSIEGHPTQPPTPHSPTRRGLILVGATAVLIGVGLLLAVLVAGRDGDTASPSPREPHANPKAAVTTTTINPRTEVIIRLREILDVREEAFQIRDVSLFDQIYTNDCPCLSAGREAIARLLEENVVWRERSISLQIQSATRVNDRLWEVVALFLSKPFRIETEQGRLIRRVPEERLRYRFLLVKPAVDGSWLLGRASLLRGA